MDILLFAGTTEGRVLAERLAALPDVAATICVATDYGRETLGRVPDRFRVNRGRLDAAEMRELMRRGRFALAIDATHPYAALVSENIRTAAEAAGIPRLGLLRSESGTPGCVRVPTLAAAAERIAGMTGNVLLTTGVKGLAEFARIPGYAERMFPRVLPSAESIRRCEELGFRRGHIIAMQGPFGTELNRAILRQYGIAAMVTKDGGAEGGLPEKMRAAEETGVMVVLIGRPPQAAAGGMDVDAVMERVAGMLKEDA